MCCKPRVNEKHCCGNVQSDQKPKFSEQNATASKSSPTNTERESDKACCSLKNFKKIEILHHSNPGCRQRYLPGVSRHCAPHVCSRMSKSMFSSRCNHRNTEAMRAFSITSFGSENEYMTLPSDEYQPKSKVAKLFKICTECEKTHNVSLKTLFKICEQYPDCVIRAYENEHPNENKPTLDDQNSYIKSTLGETLGDSKYRYLDIDASTSTTQAVRVKLSVVAVEIVENPPDEWTANSLSDQEESETAIPLKLTPSVFHSSQTVLTLGSDTEQPEVREKRTPGSSNEYSNTRDDSYDLIRKIRKHNEKAGITPGATESQEVNYSSEEDRQEQTPTPAISAEARRVSIMSWGNTMSKPSESVQDVTALESKQRVESTISKIMSEKKRRDRHSIFHEVVRTEKKKTELDEVLANAEKESIYTNTGSFMVPQKTKCCGLIKVKPKTRDSRLDSSNGIAVVTRGKNHRKPVPSSSSSEENGSRRSSLENYKRRNSPVKNPVFEKNKKIKKYSHNL